MQLSYDSKLDNMDKLITLLVSVPLYKPNEEDLKVNTLKTLYSNLNSLNSNVVSAFINLSNARIARNNTLYNPLTGLVDIAFDTKMYIKSIFGASSPQFKQVSKVKFKSKSK